jgi:hypothetical protein
VRGKEARCGDTVLETVLQVLSGDPIRVIGGWSKSNWEIIVDGIKQELLQSVAGPDYGVRE